MRREILAKDPHTKRGPGKALGGNLEGNKTRATATIVVGHVTPLARQEIEELGGTVRQVCDEPQLFLAQIPHDEWVSSHPADWDSEEPQDRQDTRADIEIGSDDETGGYLLLHSDGWMCEYRQHPYDLTKTALRSFNDPPGM